MRGYRSLVIVALFSMMVIPAIRAQETDDEGFRSILPSEAFDGWVLVNTPPSTWRIEDGMLICSGKPIGEIRTDRMYQNFILEVEWRHMVPGGNAGIFLWADDITAKGQPFHRSIEVQVLDHGYGQGAGHTTHGDIFPIHGATMKPINGRGGSRAFPTEERSLPSPEWNHYRIECNDGKVTLAVNGKVVTQGTDCSPRKGYLCLESEGGIVHYRKIRIKELPDSPVQDSDIAIADRGYRSLYDGLSLEGWKVLGDGSSWTSQDWVLAHRQAEGQEPAALESNESFGEHGFVIDFRWSKKTRGLTLERRGAQANLSLVLNDTEGLPDSLQREGWNRIEGQIDSGKLTVTLNGQPWIDLQADALTLEKGPWRIQAEGDVDLANLYVRRPDGKRE